MLLLYLTGIAALGLALLYWRQPYWAWVASGFAFFNMWGWGDTPLRKLFWPSAGIFLIVALVFGVRPLRRKLITPLVLRFVGPLLPTMSDTEREALDAGTVWWDAELFSGRPRWKRLLDFVPPGLTADERAFLEGPVEDVCGMMTDWEAMRAGDLPAEVWEALKRHRFFGMILPQKYGGLGFSALAHSAVIAKLGTRSGPLCVTVMVPNSLGPGELLLHYGTEEQKQRWLPRLAAGEELPAFALTEPGAGSDAGAMTSNGVVAWGEWEGQRVVGVRLNWDKRYITLAPVATLLGLAFQMRDPDGILGDRPALGITCALVPTDLPGVEVGRRHDPLGVAFLNGPTRGRDVFVPLDAIIGGPAMAGQGWRMLMQTLAAGRGISLPSLSCGVTEAAVRATGAYATVREQFGIAIGRFEGIEEPLSRIAGRAYLVDSARRLTVGAIDAGEKPSVLTAIVKCYLTEAMRASVTDAMDILGGAGIARGPRNMISSAWQAVPIGITVEGANILTRSMIVFGQGAIRCHPWVQREMASAAAKDVRAFDEAFFGHVGFVFTNLGRAFLLGLTGGNLAPAPVRGPMGSTYSQLTRMSAAYALLADVCMGTLGGSLKFREKITGRMADALSWMYLASAALKRFHDDDSPERDLPYVRWTTQTALRETQDALLGVLDNLPLRVVGWALKPLLFPWGARHRGPDDELGATIARSILEGGEGRERLTQNVYVPHPDEPGLGTLERALGHVLAARPVHAAIREAIRARQLDRNPQETLLQRALALGVITQEQTGLVQQAARARAEAIAVDAFDPEELMRREHPRDEPAEIEPVVP